MRQEKPELPNLLRLVRAARDLVVPESSLPDGYCVAWSVTFHEFMRKVGVKSVILCGTVDIYDHFWVSLPALRVWCDGTADQFSIPRRKFPKAMAGPRKTFPHHIAYHHCGPTFCAPGKALGLTSDGVVSPVAMNWANNNSRLLSAVRLELS